MRSLFCISHKTNNKMTPQPHIHDEDFRRQNVFSFSKLRLKNSKADSGCSGFPHQRTHTLHQDTTSEIALYLSLPQKTKPTQMNRTKKLKFSFSKGVGGCVPVIGYSILEIRKWKTGGVLSLRVVRALSSPFFSTHTQTVKRKKNKSAKKLRSRLV